MPLHQFEGTSESREMMVAWAGIGERRWKEKRDLKTHLKDELVADVLEVGRGVRERENPD